MAKNYTFSEAVAIIANGENMEAIADISRRFPILAFKVNKVATLAGDHFVDLMSYMPEYMTANKVNSSIKSINASANEVEEDDDAEEPAKLPEAKEGEVMPDYTAMSGKELWNILGEAGARKLAKSTKKPDLVEACEEMWKKLHTGEVMPEAEAEAETEPEAEAEANDEAESENPYEGKSAMELFKMCKQRKIKAKAKQKAKYYEELLIADDNKKVETESETAAEEPDDWEEAETEVEEVKEEKKPAKKAAKKEEVEDEDDDWDI